MTDDVAGQKRGDEESRKREVSDTSTPASSTGNESSSPDKQAKGSSLPPQKRLTKRRILLFTLFVIIVLIVAAYATIGVEQFPSQGGISYPFATTYDVLFPDGKQVFIGSTPITALSYQNEVIVDIGGDRERMLVGEERLVSERRAIIRTLGISIVDTQYQIYIRFLGVVGNQIHFNLTLKTSQQVPQFLIERVLPPEIQARPV